MVSGAKNVNWYPWLSTHFRQLIANYQIDCKPHTLLIRSLPGMGEDMLIYAISSFLTCHKPEKYKSCNRCHSCQLMRTQTHPDFYVIKPTESKTMLGVDIVYEVNRKMREYSLLGKAKVIWFKNAMQLTTSAVNALLKILEEPPENSWFFLSCREPGRLLPTLRSRCLLYHLKVPNETWAVNWLSHKVITSIEARITALRLCGGAPIAALDQLQTENWSSREQLCNMLNNVLNNDNWLDLMKVLNHKQITQRLHWLMSLFLDAIKMQYNSMLLTNTDVRSLINNLAIKFSRIAIQNIIYDIYKLYKQLSTISGLNYELLLTNLLLRIEYYSSNQKLH